MISRSTFAKRLLPRPAVPAERCVTRRLSIVTQRRGGCVIVTENPKTIGGFDRCEIRLHCKAFVDPTFFFHFSFFFLISYKSFKLQITRVAFELRVQFSNEQETLKKENEASWSRIEKSLRSGAGSLFLTRRR